MDKVAAKLCDMQERKDGRWECRNCGVRRKVPTIRECMAGRPSSPRSVKEAKARSVPRRGLGDWAEKALATMGITEERYAEIKQAVGLPPGCNCAKRKAWLNKVGAYLGL